jgi:hypothetical protein
MNDTPSQPGLLSLSELEAAAYTFGLTNAPDPSLSEFLSAVITFLNNNTTDPSLANFLTELITFLSGGDSTASSADLLTSPTAIVDALSTGPGPASGRP